MVNSNDDQSPGDCYEEDLEILDAERNVKSAPAYAEYNAQRVANKEVLRAKLCVLNREYDAKIALLDAKYLDKNG